MQRINNLQRVTLAHFSTQDTGAEEFLRKFKDFLTPDIVQECRSQRWGKTSKGGSNLLKRLWKHERWSVKRFLIATTILSIGSLTVFSLSVVSPRSSYITIKFSNFTVNKGSSRETVSNLSLILWYCTIRSRFSSMGIYWRTTSPEIWTTTKDDGDHTDHCGNRSKNIEAQYFVGIVWSFCPFTAIAYWGLWTKHHTLNSGCWTWRELNLSSLIRLGLTFLLARFESEVNGKVLLISNYDLSPAEYHSWTLCYYLRLTLPRSTSTSIDREGSVLNLLMSFDFKSYEKANTQ